MKFSEYLLKECALSFYHVFDTDKLSAFGHTKEHLEKKPKKIKRTKKEQEEYQQQLTGSKLLQYLSYARD